jgi:hypothetical protein
MTRQEFTDAVAEVLGIHATEMRVDTITRLADAYAATFAAGQLELALAAREAGRG